MQHTERHLKLAEDELQHCLQQAAALLLGVLSGVAGECARSMRLAVHAGQDVDVRCRQNLQKPTARLDMTFHAKLSFVRPEKRGE